MDKPTAESEDMISGDMDDNKIGSGSCCSQVTIVVVQYT